MTRVKLRPSGAPSATGVVSVHTNAKGKYATAVYEVRHQWPPDGVQGGLMPFVEGLFPRSRGRNVLTFDFRLRGDGSVSYLVLISNHKQTTPNDIARKLRERDPSVTVEAVCAVPETGEPPAPTETSGRATATDQTESIARQGQEGGHR
jgi:hypothetical protein